MKQAVQGTFDAKARILVGKFARYWQDGENELLNDKATQQKILSTGTVGSIKAPQNLWVEFLSKNRIHNLIFGTLDRVDLLADRNGRLAEYLGSINSEMGHKFDDYEKDRIIGSLLRARAAVLAGKFTDASLAQQFSRGIAIEVREAKSKNDFRYAQLLIDLRKVILNGVSCFESKCHSSYMLFEATGGHTF